MWGGPEEQCGAFHGLGGDDHEDDKDEVDSELPPLREGWYEADDGAGNTYYYNADMETTWDRPV